MRKFAFFILSIALSSAALATVFDNKKLDLINRLIGKSYSGTPWVFESTEEFTQFEILRNVERGDYSELFVYMSLQAERACHNTLGLITTNKSTNEILSVDMVHHAPAKKCLTYDQFKNP